MVLVIRKVGELKWKEISRVVVFLLLVIISLRTRFGSLVLCVVRELDLFFRVVTLLMEFYIRLVIFVLGFLKNYFDFFVFFL